jgi:acyl-CoA synthetase (AMP-forming)/AMP-acid ligase II
MKMPITEILARNAALYGEDISMVEINPEIREVKASWKEYELVETNPEKRYRREMTWREFDDKSNRFANLLRQRGMERGHKFAILLMNCLEWLPVYFGILKTGAIAVPLNYRYTEEEIKYCLDLAGCDALIFGPEFTDRIEAIRERIPNVKLRLFVGQDCPASAENYYSLTACCSSVAPKIALSDDDDAALAKRLTEILRDDELARSLGAEGRRVAAAKFSREAQLAATEWLYRSLTGD